VLHKVLVSRVQHTVPAGGSDDDSGGGAPEGTSLVTLVLTAPQAEQVVYGVEHGTIWLSLEADGAPEAGTKIVAKENVYQ
jgi:pilus assembly protein CpaB